MTKNKEVHIIGAGLAGSEAAWQIANRGINVIIHEMRPTKLTPAHKTNKSAELVCSNSLRSDDYTNSAIGVLHQEMRLLGSLIMEAADATKVPAGGALAVDREGFSDYVDSKLHKHPNIRFINEEVCSLPDDNIHTIIASGPLTSPSLIEAIMDEINGEGLNFFDAIAPVIYKDSIDFSKAWYQSRYDKGDKYDYINCPLTETQYYEFVEELIKAEKVEFHDFEKASYFDGCLPIEVMAERGKDTLLFGPMKPVGLTNANNPEEKPYAVVQLRQDNKEDTLRNMVGFQTKMKYGEQERIFRKIPGLEKAIFARLGGIHKNTFIKSPILLDDNLRLKTRNNICGRTIQVADKGLNCAENIFHAIKHGDGYIFSKSVKQLPETERTWILSPNDYRDVTNKKGELLYKIKECVDDFEYKIKTETEQTRTIKLPEKRIVTYNPSLAKKQRLEILREVEKAKALKAAQAKKSEYGDCAKYVKFTPVDKQGDNTDGKIKVSLNKELIEKNLKLAGYNLLVTSETSMSAKEIYDTYHNLWRIEESFRIMKSQLDARPVYLQKEQTITGHFLICYLAVLLTRLFQFKILKNNFCSEEVFDFIHDFRVAKISDKKYINLAKSSNFITEFSLLTELPISSYFLSDGQIKKMLSHRF